ncbi:MAG: polymer-forming cytoskeletal protein [Lachnospiraceae bacterium]|nr:polymer-forming cytoskeletal protein [Lachnospiraceae bacterium]
MIEESVPDVSESGMIEESVPDASENSMMEESMPDTAENNMIEESMPDTAADTEIIKEAEADKMSEEVMEMDSTAVNEEGKEVEKEGVKNMQEQLFGENEVASDEKSVITEGMTITGDIISKGSLEIFGTITGNIEILGKLDVTGVVNGNSKAAEIYAESAKIVGEVNSLGSVKVGQSSVIIGNIMASSAVVAGAVKGDIDVKGPVILDTSAIVMGNIKSKSVQINNGAVVEGMCSQCYADVNPTAFFDEFKKTAKI